MSPPLDPRLVLRALVETILPGRAEEVRAERFVHDGLLRVGEDALVGALMALDAYAAAVREGADFVGLDLDERSRVLRTIASDPNADLRQLARLLFSLTVAAVYGEWSGLDDDGRLVRRPTSWDAIGYPGPSTGYELSRRAPGTDG